MERQIEILYDSEDSWQYFDLYHALAGEVQHGIASILDNVLSRYDITSEETRRKIVTSFLFDYGEAIDCQAAIENDCDSAKWYPALCFLKREQISHIPGDVNTVLLSINTDLHGISLDQAESFYEKHSNK